MERSIKLIGLPFAGAQNYSYQALSRYLDDRIDLLTVELPGRGRRGGEEFLDSLEEMADYAYERIGGSLRDGAYAVYGHSMGAMLTYLLAHKIRREAAPPPICLIVSGHGAPNTPLRHRGWHRLPDRDFGRRLMAFGGFPVEILRNREMMEYFGPILRADFKAYETFRYRELEPLRLPILAMVGSDEWATLDNARKWGEMTTRSAFARELPGKHFFIFEEAAQAAGLVNGFIAASLRTT